MCSTTLNLQKLLVLQILFLNLDFKLRTCASTTHLNGIFEKMQQRLVWSKKTKAKRHEQLPTREGVQNILINKENEFRISYSIRPG